MVINFKEITWEEYASALPRTATDTERLMAAFAFRLEHEGVDTAEVSLISDNYFRRARWPRPTNLFATANYCAAKGWLSEDSKTKGRKTWRVTRKGYESMRTRIMQ
jgi:hypothetical protein